MPDQPAAKSAWNGLDRVGGPRDEGAAGVRVTNADGRRMQVRFDSGTTREEAIALAPRE
jgi:hypothetical protein